MQARDYRGEDGLSQHCGCFLPDPAQALLLGVCFHNHDLSAQRSVAPKCLQPIEFAPQNPSPCRGSRGCDYRGGCDTIRSEANAAGVSGTCGGRLAVLVSVPKLSEGDMGSHPSPAWRSIPLFWGNSLGNPSLGCPVHCMSERAGDAQVGPTKTDGTLHWSHILTFPALASAKITGFISGISPVQVEPRLWSLLGKERSQPPALAHPNPSACQSRSHK